MNAIPDFLLEKATRRGISRDQALELWGGHRRWCAEHGKESGGLLWDALLDKFIERAKAETRLDDADAESFRRIASEREAKARDDAAYALTAVSLRDWVASLRARHLDGEALEPHERVLAEGELPQGHESAASFLMASLDHVRTFDGQLPRRPQPCGHPDCGLPAHSWVGLGGRRYYSGRCADHTPKEDWSRQ